MILVVRETLVSAVALARDDSAEAAWMLLL